MSKKSKQLEQILEDAATDTQEEMIAVPVDDGENAAPEPEPQQEAKPRKKPTRPWQPAARLDVPAALKRNGYRLHWKRKRDIEKAMLEGWNPVVDKRLKSVLQHTQEDRDRASVGGAGLGTSYEMRELILCEMPEELALGREEYHKKLTDSRLVAGAKKAASKGVTITEIPDEG
jgi:hypothetical protein